MASIGPLELAVVLIVALLILGPKRLPQAGRSLGRGVREFKHGLTSSSTELKAGLASSDGEAEDRQS
jgi:sec-independent protein translocase protein TatA